MKNKKTLVSVLATVLCCSALAAVGTIAASADTVGTVDASSFAMVSGASVRIGDGTTENPYGIRFTATMDPTAYANLEKLEETAGVSVNYGMIILPYDKLPANSSNLKDVFFGASSNFCFEESGHLDTCEKYHVKEVKTAELNTADEDYPNKAVLKGSLTNVLNENRTRPFVGVGYIEHDDNGTKTYVIADYDDDDIQNNVSSMTYVAQKAVEDTEEDAPTDDEKKTLTASYITPYANKKAKYTVNEYILNDAGEVVSQNTRTAEAAFNKVVTYAYDTTLDTDFNKSLKSYIVSQNKGLLTSNVYANNKTELNVYYSKTISDLSSAEDKDYFYVTDNGAANDGHERQSSISYDETESAIKIVADTAVKGYYAGSVALKLAQDQWNWLNGTADFDYISIRMKASSGISNAKLTFGPLVGGVDYDNADKTQNEWFDLKIDKENLAQNVYYNSSATRKSFYVDNIAYDVGNVDGVANTVYVRYKDRFGTTTVSHYAKDGTDTTAKIYNQNLASLTTITYYIDNIAIGKDTEDSTAPTLIKNEGTSTLGRTTSSVYLGVNAIAHATDDVSYVTAELLGLSWTTYCANTAGNTNPLVVDESYWIEENKLTMYTTTACTTEVGRVFPKEGKYIDTDGTVIRVKTGGDYKQIPTVYVKADTFAETTGYFWLVFKYRLVDSTGNATIAYACRRVNKTA